MSDALRVEGYRWCPVYGGMYEWDESQVQGCLWCDDGDPSDHDRLARVANARPEEPS